MDSEEMKNNEEQNLPELLHTPENQQYVPSPMDEDFVNDFDNLKMEDTPSVRYIRKHVSADNSSNDEDAASLASVESIPVMRKRKKVTFVKDKSWKRRRIENRKYSEERRRRNRHRSVRRILDFTSEGDNELNNRPPTPYPNMPAGRRRVQPVRPSMKLKNLTAPGCNPRSLSPVSDSEAQSSSTNMFRPMNITFDSDDSS